MIRFLTWLVALIVAFGAMLAPPPAQGQSGLPPAPYAYKQIEDPAKEAQARELMHELRCLVCQGQSIADSDAPLAGDMRSQVRERIAAGESPDQVRSWLVDRYGAWVTYDPPLGKETILLFIAPLLALLFGAWLVLGRLRRGPESIGEISA